MIAVITAVNLLLKNLKEKEQVEKKNIHELKRNHETVNYPRLFDDVGLYSNISFEVVKIYSLSARQTDVQMFLI